LPPQKPKGSVKSSESVANEENQQKSLQSSALSLDVIKKYILKMMKTHQQKLSHVLLNFIVGNKVMRKWSVC
jgi:hypothetical protein